MLVSHKKGELVEGKFSANFAKRFGLRSYWAEDGWHCNVTGKIVEDPESLKEKR